MPLPAVINRLFQKPFVRSHANSHVCRNVMRSRLAVDTIDGWMTLEPLRRYHAADAAS